MTAGIFEDLQLALDLADMADVLASDRFRAADLTISTKPDRTPVTDADQAVEQAIRAALRDARRDDGVLGEEYGGEPLPGRQWIIDPIDGTTNFLRGLPIWATLIALAVDGVPVLGVVAAPALRPPLVGRARQRRLDGHGHRTRHAAPPPGSRCRRWRSCPTPCSATTRSQGWDEAGAARRAARPRAAAAGAPAASATSGRTCSSRRGRSTSAGEPDLQGRGTWPRSCRSSGGRRAVHLARRRRRPVARHGARHERAPARGGPREDRAADLTSGRRRALT